MCGAAFSIEHGGKSDITQHLKSERHNIAARVSKSQCQIFFFQKHNLQIKNKNKL